MTSRTLLQSKTLNETSLCTPKNIQMQDESRPGSHRCNQVILSSLPQV